MRIAERNIYKMRAGERELPPDVWTTVRASIMAGERPARTTAEDIYRVVLLRRDMIECGMSPADADAILTAGALDWQSAARRNQRPPCKLFRACRELLDTITRNAAD